VHRPINLIGYGMGARLIYHCLEALIDEVGGEENLDSIKGMIENVVMIGTPVAVNYHKYGMFRSIVSSRFIHCYSRYDWILALLYRSKCYEFRIAGLYPINLPGSSLSNNTSSRSDNNGKELFIKGVKTVEGKKAGEETFAIELEDTKATIQNEVQEKEKQINEMLLQSGKELQSNIENYDITDIVHLQTDYPKVLPTIMKLIKLQ
jgi:hypothetical protein